MVRQRALQAVLVIVGVLFCAFAYGMLVFIHRQPALAMMASVYATLGVFLLLAVREPAAHRSLIAFTAWSSFAHAGLMTVQAHRHFIQAQSGTGWRFFARLEFCFSLCDR